MILNKLHSQIKEGGSANIGLGFESPRVQSGIGTRGLEFIFWSRGELGVGVWAFLPCQLCVRDQI